MVHTKKEKNLKNFYHCFNDFYHYFGKKKNAMATSILFSFWEAAHFSTFFSFNFSENSSMNILRSENHFILYSKSYLFLVSEHIDPLNIHIKERNKIRWHNVFFQLECKILNRKHSLHFRIPCLTQNSAGSGDSANYSQKSWWRNDCLQSENYLIQTSLGYIWSHYLAHHF